MPSESIGGHQRSTVKYVITHYTPKTSHYIKKCFCQTYKNDKSIIKLIKANCKKQKR